MAEYLNMSDMDIRAHVANAMQALLLQQEQQIAATVERVTHGLQLAQWDFYGLDMQRGNPEEYRQAFDSAVRTMAIRTAWLADNPLEEVQARLEASAARTAEALARAPARTYDDLEAEYDEDGSPLYPDAEDPSRPQTVEERQEGHEYGTQYANGFEGENIPGEEPGAALKIDASDTSMGATWQQQLAEIEARLESLLQKHQENDFQAHVDHTEGMSY